MPEILLRFFEEPRLLLRSLPTLAFLGFVLWMLIHAGRNRDWGWLALMVIFPFAAVWYFFQIYRDLPSSTRGFELPGAHSRRRIKELQAQIHHLDKPHHHLQLGDIRFQRGQLELAEKSYRAALERDGADLDIRSHLGQCLLRQKKPAEARPLLEGVVRENPKHDYGYTAMALAETCMAQGENDSAVQLWERILQQHSYARARVQLAELYLAWNQPAAAREQLEEVIQGDAHAPAFDRRRNRVWLRRAKSLARSLK